MLRKYKTILVIQSYPTLTHVVNNISSLPKPALVVILFEGNIYKFLRDLNIEGVHIASVGSSMILRKSVLSFLRGIYIRRVISFCKKLSTDNLIITYRTMNMSALTVYFLRCQKLKIWVPYEEKRYQYDRHQSQKLLKFNHRYQN